ncbi:hypothetical protein POM88_045530 [Heracleum sosnowskyi]|uniref:Transposase-associated domain-containing protein n=1 Tax=Heracleum sosnowskyi TaxID=360622 RepID=A0AAD8H634_9APIA|nr:hypothetical protein POM88_045530 [Heracleum sosnowskyi]
MWIYKISRATQDYVDGVEKFIECEEGNLKKKRGQGKEYMITCPCHDCYNLKKYPSVAIVRDHLFSRGFMADYTKWIWHGEGIHSEKSKTSDGNRGSIGESMPTNKEDDAENDRMNEMIEYVEELLVHQSKILENLVDDSKKLLYPGCNDQFTRKSKKKVTEIPSKVYALDVVGVIPDELWNVSYLRLGSYPFYQSQLHLKNVKLVHQLFSSSLAKSENKNLRSTSPSSTALIGGVAYGGYARKIVGRIMNSMQALHGHAFIEDHPEHLVMALTEALGLVGPIKCYASS